MDPIKTVRSNFTYKGPSRDIGDLPVQRTGNVVYSVWELTDEEREEVANGANIELGIHNMEPIPPVSLNTNTDAKADD